MGVEGLSTYFTGGRADLLREVNGPLASRGGPYRYSRKHIGLNKPEWSA